VHHIVAESEGCLLVGGEWIKYLVSETTFEAGGRGVAGWGAPYCGGFSLVPGSRLAAVLAPLEVVLQPRGSARGV
jgi:hypothetical protein